MQVTLESIAHPTSEVTLRRPLTASDLWLSLASWKFLRACLSDAVRGRPYQLTPTTLSSTLQLGFFIGFPFLSYIGIFRFSTLIKFRMNIKALPPRAADFSIRWPIFPRAATLGAVAPAAALLARAFLNFSTRTLRAALSAARFALCLLSNPSCYLCKANEFAATIKCRPAPTKANVDEQNDVAAFEGLCRRRPTFNCGCEFIRFA